jgi:hypothetical protein
MRIAIEIRIALGRVGGGRILAAIREQQAQLRRPRSPRDAARPLLIVAADDVHALARAHAERRVHRLQRRHVDEVLPCRATFDRDARRLEVFIEHGADADDIVLRVIRDEERHEDLLGHHRDVRLDAHAEPVRRTDALDHTGGRALPVVAHRFVPGEVRGREPLPLDGLDLVRVREHDFESCHAARTLRRANGEDRALLHSARRDQHRRNPSQAHRHRLWCNARSSGEPSAIEALPRSPTPTPLALRGRGPTPLSGKRGPAPLANCAEGQRRFRRCPVKGAGPL